MVFRDRAEAATKLAEKLGHLRGEDIIVLAIPRGGVVTGDVLARAIGAKLDVVAPRKLGAPHNPELAIGAVMHDGSTFLNEEIVQMLRVPKDYVEKETVAQMKEIERRLVRFRGSSKYELKGKYVILVDDGIATGATMFAAARWVRKQGPRKLIVAVPVGPPDTISRLRQEADEVIILLIPSEFAAVGEFYDDFGQVTDEEVQQIMRGHGYKI